MNDRSDAQTYELSGIVVDDILEPVRHVGFQVQHCFMNSIGYLERVRARLLVDPNANRLLVIDQGTESVFRCP